jgi:hypothetical protein
LLSLPYLCLVFHFILSSTLSLSSLCLVFGFVSVVVVYLLTGYDNFEGHVLSVAARPFFTVYSLSPQSIETKSAKKHAHLPSSGLVFCLAYERYNG